MIFADKTKDLVAQSVALAKRMANDARKHEADMFGDYLDGDQMGYIPKNKVESAQSWNARQKVAFPFADMIISELSMLYKKPPARSFDGENSAADKKYREWLEAGEEDGHPHNILLLDHDKKARMMGNVAVRVSADKEGGYPRFDCFTPDQIDILQDPKRPGKAASVILTISRRDTAHNTPNIYEVWTPDTYALIDDGKLREEPNKLKYIPIVWFCNSIETQRFWSPPMGRKLVPANVAFDKLWTELLHLCITKSNGIPWGKGLDPQWVESVKDGVEGFGVGGFMLMGKDGEVGLLHPQTQIAELLEAGREIILNACRICGVPVNKFMQDGAPESGYAYMVKQSGVLEDRELRATMMRPKDRALWRTAFDVGDLELGGAPDPRDIVVDYAEPEIPVPMNERLEEINWKLENHLTTRVALLRDEDPDLLTDEDAQAKLDENKEMNDQMTKKPKQAGESVGGFLAGLGIGKQEEDEE